MLFEALRALCDVVDAHTAKKIAEFAIKFAGDHRVPQHPLHGHEQQHSGMNPYRIDTGWPQEVRGKALLTVAEISVHKPDVVAAELKDLLLRGMADRDPEVRRHAYLAVGVAGSSAMDCLPTPIGGTRDNDPMAANTALQVAGQFGGKSWKVNGSLPYSVLWRPSVSVSDRAKMSRRVPSAKARKGWLKRASIVSGGTPPGSDAAI